MLGRLAVFPPGCRIQLAQAVRSESEQELLLQPLQAIQVASGAMPVI